MAEQRKMLTQSMMRNKTPNTTHSHSSQEGPSSQSPELAETRKYFNSEKKKIFCQKLEILHQDTRKYFNNKIFQPSVARLESLVLGNLNIGSIYYRVMMWWLLS